MFHWRFAVNCIHTPKRTMIDCFLVLRLLMHFFFLSYAPVYSKLKSVMLFSFFPFEKFFTKKFIQSMINKPIDRQVLF
jgi:hypothetical protein